VYSIANSLTPEFKFGITITTGTLKGYRNENEIYYIQSHVNVLTGADGGPLVDNYWNAIGVCTNVGFLGEQELFNYFLPIAYALHPLDVELK